ncbi:endonuclease domain-containing protein [Herbiconiux sp. VKM Ac-2851]|uniref:endonuclease domain-containing protein n=1 Tax=Herbiconiux sp. VKM Ac-2851 TaxID=2739025 RepID=UPI00156772C6|nr:hypothetical protein [Herbiconiux sp. VKM Ac-2851]NQX34211.1 hypothetical protein [Herbiconiux sp. VKM Ac-2851]
MPRRVPLPPELLGRPFHVQEAVDFGVTLGRLRGADLNRPFCGVRDMLGETGDLVARCSAYATRMRGDQVFSHTTAARLWDVPLPPWIEDEPVVHVSTIGGGTRPRLPGIVGHRLVASTRCAVRRGLRVTDAGATWLQLAEVLRDDDLVIAADHFIRIPRHPDPGDPRPHIEAEQLAMRAGRHRGRGRRSALRAVERMREGSDSPRETRLRLALIAAGLPEPRLNLRIEAGGRFIGFGDLVYPEWKVVVEYDGEQHRLDSDQYRRDVARHEALLEAGWVHIRESRTTPFSGPDSAVSRTRRALALRGWR